MIPHSPINSSNTCLALSLLAFVKREIYSRILPSAVVAMVNYTEISVGELHMLIQIRIACLCLKESEKVVIIECIKWLS
jgi:hypothetical protein